MGPGLGAGVGRRGRLRQRGALRPGRGRTPELILDHYQPPVLGWLAFGWLVVFVTVLVITCVYETRLRGQQRQARRATRPADTEGIR